MAASIDPLFSSGVHLAMTSGLSAAASIAASIRGDCSESHAAEWHTQRVGVSYIRFLVVVLSAYKQMRAQSKDILCNIGEDNFDNAISFLRPVIHGNADLGPRLSDVEVQNALSFCAGLFTPVNPGASRAPRRYLGGGDEDPVPAPQESRTKLTKQDDVMAVRSSVGWSSVKPDAVTRWLEKVGGIPRDVLSDPFPYCPLTTPATPDRPSLPPRGGGRALSNTIPLLQAPSQHKLRRNFTALMDLNSPHVPPIRIRNIVGRQPCLPKGGSKVETRDGMKCIFEGMNDRGIINPKPGGLHSLEEELLGAGYTMRLQRGRLGLEARDWLS
ncbi:hypothetical protein F5148DRAFT_262128 [Russula earlei]|uniref:Uncharacterized protein n=1 Tax=Russula earlei TaxID=71964 RepID=A0ACC0UK85_9AGAM|nr:hypothetical protein F5148DRAFT_262128 [Russula earlei]